MGYSPFVKEIQSKNALMMAIEGNHVEIVEMISKFTYTDS